MFTFVPGTIPGFFAFGGGGLLSLILNIIVFIAVSSFTKARPESLMAEHEKQADDFYNKRY